MNDNGDPIELGKRSYEPLVSCRCHPAHAIVYMCRKERESIFFLKRNEEEEETHAIRTAGDADENAASAAPEVVAHGGLLHAREECSHELYDGWKEEGR